MDTSDTYVSGERLLVMLHSSLLWIGIHREELNQQNVYPVPDGDTGVNLWLTLKSACQAAEQNQRAGGGGLVADCGPGELWKDPEEIPA